MGTIDRVGNVHDSQGQFAGRQQTEGDPDELLGGVADPGYTMLPVTLPARWGAYEVPPGCRKERWVQHKVLVPGEVRSIGTDQVVGAFTVAPDEWREDSDWYSFDGHLYRPWLTDRQQTEAHDFTEGFLLQRLANGEDAIRTGAESDEEAIRQVQDRLDQFLIVDGEIWCRAGEPRYVVQTFGFGGNHGGTALLVATDYNPNLQPHCYFRADEFEAAREFAIEVATNRGDTESARSIAAMAAPIVVHDPSAVTLVTPPHEPAEVKKARSDYDDAVYRFAGFRPEFEGVTSEALVKAKAELDAAFAALTAATDDPAGDALRHRPYEDRPATWRR